MNMCHQPFQLLSLIVCHLRDLWKQAYVSFTPRPCIHWNTALQTAIRYMCIMYLCLFIYVKVKLTTGEGETERASNHQLVPRLLQGQLWPSLKPGCWSFFRVPRVALVQECRHFLLFFPGHSRELDWKWNRWNMNLCLYRIPVFQMGILLTMPQDWDQQLPGAYSPLCTTDLYKISRF